MANPVYFWVLHVWTENSRAGIANSTTYRDKEGREGGKVNKWKRAGLIQTCEWGNLVSWRIQPHLKGQIVTALTHHHYAKIKPSIAQSYDSSREARNVDVYWKYPRWPLIHKDLIHSIGQTKHICSLDSAHRLQVCNLCPVRMRELGSSDSWDKNIKWFVLSWI